MQFKYNLSQAFRFSHIFIKIEAFHMCDYENIHPCMCCIKRKLKKTIMSKNAHKLYMLKLSDITCSFTSFKNPCFNHG